MANEQASPKSKDRLSPSWIRRSLSPLSKKPTRDTESRLLIANGLLSTRPSSSRSNSNDSRSTRSNKSGMRNSFRGVVNRVRSSSSVSSLNSKSRDTNVNDIHDWFQGFRCYNQLVTSQSSTTDPDKAQAFAKATKSLTKNCGGKLIHGLPEAAFDFALLWCPADQVTRRNSDEPSWSWTAFTSPVNFPFDPTTCPDVYMAPKSEGELFRSEITNFHVGPRHALYTIRREKNNSMRAQFPPYFHAPWGKDASVESGTLRFSAESISAEGFTLEQLKYKGKDILCSQLINEVDRHCGVLMTQAAYVSTPTSTPSTYEFIALSRSLRRAPAPHKHVAAYPAVHPVGTPIWNGEGFVWDEVVSDFDEEVFAEGQWNVINVMLIKWLGDGEDGYAERVAVGRMHEDVWKTRGPRRGEVILR